MSIYQNSKLEEKWGGVDLPERKHSITNHVQFSTNKNSTRTHNVVQPSTCTVFRNQKVGLDISTQFITYWYQCRDEKLVHVNPQSVPNLIDSLQNLFLNVKNISRAQPANHSSSRQCTNSRASTLKASDARIRIYSAFPWFGTRRVKNTDREERTACELQRRGHFLLSWVMSVQGLCEVLSTVFITPAP